MKKTIFILFVAFSLLLTGCSSNTEEPQNTLPSESETPTTTEPEKSEDPTNEEVNYDLPEHITSDSIKDVTEVHLSYDLTVDGKDIIFTCANIKVPSGLEVDEAMELGATEDVEPSAGTLVKDFFNDPSKQYVFVETKGTLNGTYPSTKHTLEFEIETDDEPFTVAELKEDFPSAKIEEITVDGKTAYLVQPDTEKNDGGLINTMLFVNLGSYDYGYGTAYFGIELYYEGGMADYSEVNFDEIKNMLIYLVSVNFGEVK